jgi:hypothetical protein
MENKVNHPAHYGGKDNPFEPIKIIEHYDLNFMLGNCIKYVLRAGKKGDKLVDLEKALWNLQREVDNMKNKSKVIEEMENQLREEQEYQLKRIAESYL